MAAGIYVGIRIRGPLERVWELTQTPSLHQRWDLRFSAIEYSAKEHADAPQRFLYRTRIGFGLAIEGAGESIATREHADGARASSLKFWSDDAKSLIREGSGYWKYEPHGRDVHFYTYYDYRARFGVVGRALDRLLFRPLIGWATAWSFDRLRLWIERGIEPESSRDRALVHALARTCVAFVFLWHGLVPKLVFMHADELSMLLDAGSTEATARAWTRAAGWAEIAFALLLVVAWHARWPLWLAIAGMVAATTLVACASPRFLTAAFNPVTLDACVAVLAVIALVAGRDLPSARRCARMPERDR